MSPGFSVFDATSNRRCFIVGVASRAGDPKRSFNGSCAKHKSRQGKAIPWILVTSPTCLLSTIFIFFFFFFITTFTLHLNSQEVLASATFWEVLESRGHQGYTCGVRRCAGAVLWREFRLAHYVPEAGDNAPLAAPPLFGPHLFLFRRKKMCAPPFTVGEK